MNDRPSKRLRRHSLPDLVVTSLLSDIESGALQPGETLAPESELAAEFGVSRSVIREALRTLQVRGIVAIANGVGSVIQPLTPISLDHYFDFAARFDKAPDIKFIEVRRALEIEAARLAASRVNEEELEEMESLLQSMQDAIEDPPAFVEHDTAFHLTIAGASRNVMLRHLIQAVREPLRSSIEGGLRNWTALDKVERVHQIHVSVFQAIAAGDSRAAVEAMEYHFEQALEVVGTPADKS